MQPSFQESFRERWIWQINVTRMIKFVSNWERKGNSPVAKTETGKVVKSSSLQRFTFL